MNHGTNGGYQMHKRRGEEACEACLEAARGYAAKYRARKGEPEKAKLKRWSKARGQALSQLAQRYPEDYQELRLAALKKIPR